MNTILKVLGIIVLTILIAAAVVLAVDVVVANQGHTTHYSTPTP